MKLSSENMRETFGRTLVELGEENPRLVVLDADLNTSTRTVLFKQRFPDRFFQCGIAEGNMMALAAGLAAMGFVVVPTTFAAFAARKALDQVFMNVCTENASVKIPGSYPGLTAAECGGSHNEVADLAIMRSLPRMRVAAPGDNREMAAFMRVAIARAGAGLLQGRARRACGAARTGRRLRVGPGPACCARAATSPCSAPAS